MPRGTQGLEIDGANDKSCLFESYLLFFHNYHSGFPRLQSLGCRALQWKIQRAQDNKTTVNQVNDIFSTSVHLVPWFLPSLLSPSFAAKRVNQETGVQT